MTSSYFRDLKGNLPEGLFYLKNFVRELFSGLREPRRLKADEIASYLDAVKLIHVEELQDWDSFKKYQDFQGISYKEYFANFDRIIKLKNDVDGFVKRFDDLNKRLKEIEDKDPTNIHFEDEIGLIRKKLLEMSNDEEKWQKVAEIQQSRFEHPVLFISHRWETLEHPDPNARQLSKLRTLEKCFIIYDYSSFPQLPRSEQEEIDFQQILKSMNKLMKNVVILHSSDYLERGWCVYEYLVSSLNCSIVCDEIQAPDFVSLRDWISTQPPFTLSFRNSTESMQQNYIHEQILTIVNRIYPMYKKAYFRTEYDNSYVTGLLRKSLMSNLPSKREAPEFLSDWLYRSWTEEELDRAFEGEIALYDQQTVPTKLNLTNVAATITDAVERQYKLDRKIFGSGEDENSFFLANYAISAITSIVERINDRISTSPKWFKCLGKVFIALFYVCNVTAINVIEIVESLKAMLRKL
jgi:hypothetical protein